MPKRSTESFINIKYLHKLKRYAIRFGVLAYLIFMTVFIGFHLYYADKILPNIYVNEMPLGGLTFDQAEALLKENLKADETKFKVKLNTYEAEVQAGSIEFQFLPVATAKKAFLVGRSASFGTNLKNKILSLLNPITLVPEYKYNNSAAKSLLNLFKIEALDEVREPVYLYENDELKIVEGKPGENFDESLAEKELIKHFVYNLNSDINPKIFMVSPTLNMQDLIRLNFDVEQIIKKKYTLVFENYRWVLDKPTVLSFLKPIKKSEKDTSLIADKSAILDKLNEISGQINRNSRGQVLEVQNGKAVEFTSSETGLRLVVKDSYDAIEKGLFDGQGIDNEEKLIQLVVEVTTPPVAANDYKIEDVLGIGTSKFKGSDAGRMHNIENASQKINGILVEPGGAFSFVEAVPKRENDITIIVFFFVYKLLG